ncbi:Arv1-like family [Novymonas esmeraldas]|uniref:Protein ARV n=1 Tax=Novymonas esmeraldas TaxID=1808958 RepID=A0AAW0EYU3_9TRYP
MPVCIECGRGVPRIIKPDTETVERCGECGHVCDFYYEFGDVQIWIDVVLLRRRAWAHVLFNDTDYYTKMIIFLLCCVVEAMVVQSLTVLQAIPLFTEDLHHSPLYTEDREVRSLQLVRILQSSFLPLMNYPATIPHLFIFTFTENALVASVATWLGRFLYRRHGHRSRRWFMEAALASYAKLSYLLFLVWAIPPSMLPMVDFVYVLWLGCAFTVLGLEHHWRYPVAAVLGCVSARGVFRYLTKWCPQILC